jgi:hypothetical protein
MTFQHSASRWAAFYQVHIRIQHRLEDWGVLPSRVLSGWKIGADGLKTNFSLAAQLLSGTMGAL